MARAAGNQVSRRDCVSRLGVLRVVRAGLAIFGMGRHSRPRRNGPFERASRRQPLLWHRQAERGGNRIGRPAPELHPDWVLPLLRRRCGRRWWSKQHAKRIRLSQSRARAGLEMRLGPGRVRLRLPRLRANARRRHLRLLWSEVAGKLALLLTAPAPKFRARRVVEAFENSGRFAARGSSGIERSAQEPGVLFELGDHTGK